MATPPSLSLLYAALHRRRAFASLPVWPARQRADARRTSCADCACRCLRDPGHPAATRPFRSHGTAIRVSAACERRDRCSVWRPVVWASARIPAGFASTRDRAGCTAVVSDFYAIGVECRCEREGRCARRYGRAKTALKRFGAETSGRH
jgi:hypothetical protein